jgi:hypothetical protein
MRQALFRCIFRNQLSGPVFNQIRHCVYGFNALVSFTLPPTAMLDATYDIFSGHVNKAALWIEAVDGLGNAYQRMTELAANSPGCYFIFCTRTQTVRGSINTGTSEERRD